MATIRGVSTMGENITILDAIGASASGTSTYHGKTRETLSLFPHYVAIGPRHISYGTKVVSGISFTTTGARNLFYDLGAFGSAIGVDASQFLPDWAEKDARNVEHSKVFYYVDRGPIINVCTDQYEVRAWNGISYRMPSPIGIKLDNEVRIDIVFPKSVKLETALAAAYEIKLFCEIVSLTKHSMQNVQIRHKQADEREGDLELYISNAETEAGSDTDFRDNFVSAGLHKSEFEQVLLSWLQSQPDHGHARRRIAGGVRLGSSYTIDRLIGAANAFDLLPHSTIPPRSLPRPVISELSRMMKEAKALESPYSEYLTNSLSHVKNANLRHKIQTRFNSLPDNLRNKFPDMKAAINHCVKARNFFVHGSETSLSTELVFKNLSFFTDVLEFIFISSDLNDGGWKSERWLKESNWGRMNHLIQSYKQHMDCIRKHLPS